MTPPATAVIVLACLIAACKRRAPAGASGDSMHVVRTSAPVAVGEGATGSLAGRRDAAHIACDTIAVLLRAAAARFGDSVTAVSSPRDTTNDFRSGPEAACAVSWSNSTSKGWPLNDVYARLDQAGWKRRPGLVQADGPGGQALAFSRAGAACVVNAEADSEDDADSTYVPKPGFVLTVTCYHDRPDFY